MPDAKPRHPPGSGHESLEGAIAQMLGLARQMLEDGVVTEGEARVLRDWISGRPEVTDRWPGNVLAARLERIFEDGVVADVERRELAGLLQDILEGDLEVILHGEGEGNALPIGRSRPEIVFLDRIFVLSGTFAWGPRCRCDEAVLKRGGLVNAWVTPQTDYLVVGSFGERDSPGTVYTTAVLEALRNRRSGIPTRIVTEAHWVEALEDTEEYPGGSGLGPWSS